MFILRDERGVKDTSHLATKVESEARYFNVSGDTLTGNLNMNGKRVINLPAPTEGHEAASKTYVDSIKASLLQDNLLRVIPFGIQYNSFHSPATLVFSNINIGIIREDDQIRVTLNRGILESITVRLSWNRIGELGQPCTLTVNAELLNPETDGRVYNLSGLIYIFNNDPNVTITVATRGRTRSAPVDEEATEPT